MARKLPPDEALDLYIRLGTRRSYRAVASHYGVSKRAVTDLARRDRWQARLEELNRKARQRALDRTEEDLEAMAARHLKVLQLIQGRALEALKRIPMSTPTSAVQAMVSALREERAIRESVHGPSGADAAESMAQRIVEFVREAQATVAEEAPEEVS